MEARNASTSRGKSCRLIARAVELVSLAAVARYLQTPE